MMYVIDSSDNGMLEQLIEYADDDADLLELAMVLLEQMVIDADTSHLEVESGMRVLPPLAHSA